MLRRVRLRLHVENDECVPKKKLDHTAVLREMALCAAARPTGTGIGLFLDDQLWNALFNVEEISTGSPARQSDVYAVACVFVHLPERVDLVNGVPFAGFSHHGTI